jgi:hypothetical protein
MVNILKYHVTVRAKTPNGWKIRSFVAESEKSKEDLRKQIEQEYDMFQIRHVTIREKI